MKILGFILVLFPLLGCKVESHPCPVDQIPIIILGPEDSLSDNNVFRMTMNGAGTLYDPEHDIITDEGLTNILKAYSVNLQLAAERTTSVDTLSRTLGRIRAAA